MSVFDPHLIHPVAPHHLSHGGLDRNDSARSDINFIRQLFKASGTRFIIVWRTQNFFKCSELGLTAMQCLSYDESELFLEEALSIYLGKDRNDNEYICLDISKYSEGALGYLSKIGQFGDLRKADPSILGDEGSILAYAKAMCFWHSKSLFCNICGSLAKSNQGGHTRTCCNLDCGATHFPRTDAAVIMAVTFENKILLGRQSMWPEGMLSVLAGFVEPGETLEHAVAREVYEEAGIFVKNVQYQHSQPWPFPASLMVGFRAEAVSTRLKVNTQEIEAAHWFSRKQINQFDGVTNFLPRKLSISRRLIEEWLVEE